MLKKVLGTLTFSILLPFNVLKTKNYDQMIRINVSDAFMIEMDFPSILEN